MRRYYPYGWFQNGGHAIMDRVHPHQDQGVVERRVLPPTTTAQFPTTIPLFTNVPTPTIMPAPVRRVQPGPTQPTVSDEQAKKAAVALFLKYGQPASDAPPSRTLDMIRTPLQEQKLSLLHQEKQDDFARVMKDPAAKAMYDQLYAEQQRAIAEAEAAREALLRKQELDRRKKAIAGADEVKRKSLFAQSRKDWDRAAKGLHERYRFFPDHVGDGYALADNVVNPVRWITYMAKNFGEAPLEAERTDSYMPYLTALAVPVAYRAMGARPLGGVLPFARGAMNAQGWVGQGLNIWNNAIKPIASDIARDFIIENSKEMLDQVPQELRSHGMSSFQDGGSTSAKASADNGVRGSNENDYAKNNFFNRLFRRNDILEEQIRDEYGALKSIPLRKLHVDYASGEDAATMEQLHHNPEYIHPDYGVRHMYKNVVVPKGKLMVNEDSANPLFVHVRYPGHHTTLINPAGLSREKIKQIAGNDFVSHALHGDSVYNALSGELGRLLVEQLGDEDVQNNGGVDAYIRGLISDDPEYNVYREEMGFVPQGLKDRIVNYIKMGKVASVGRSSGLPGAQLGGRLPVVGLGPQAYGLRMRKW